MKKRKKGWQIDDTSKHFIGVILNEKKQDVIDFRQRWKLGDRGLKNESFFPAWKKKVETECQNLRREITVSEIEAYFDAADTFLGRPVLSSEVEGRLREENWGDNLPAVFALEIRALGRKLEFPQEWDRLLEYYVIYNQMRFDLIFNQGITTSIRYRINEEFGLLSENICLTLGENTASSDLENLWKKQIKPLLKNLLVRIRDKNRKSKNYNILEGLSQEGIKTEDSQNTRVDPTTGKEVRRYDLEIAMDSMSEEKREKLYEETPPEKLIEMEEKLSRKVQNIRYYRTKRRPL